MLVTADRVFGGHLYVRNGKIAAISDDGTLPAREELDAAGLYVLPGMLDCHAHINDPASLGAKTCRTPRKRRRWAG